jgi:hypothetical protein
LSVVRFKQEKWRDIAVDIEPAKPHLVTAASELPGVDPRIPLREATDPARRS